MKIPSRGKYFSRVAWMDNGELRSREFKSRSLERAWERVSDYVIEAHDNGSRWAQYTIVELQGEDVRWLGAAVGDIREVCGAIWEASRLAASTAHHGVRKGDMPH